MRELWQAFLARLVYWLTPKPHVPAPAPIVQAPEPPLTAGTCECDHGRCFHAGGKGKCGVGYEPKSEDNPSDRWTYCACQCFVLDDDDDRDGEPETPSPEALERMFTN